MVGFHFALVSLDQFCKKHIALRTKDLVKLDRFNEHVLLVKERTLLELIFTKAPLMQWTNAFYRPITANHSPNWLSSRALGINLYQFHCLQSPFTAAHSPWTSRQQPETSRETPLNHPWTTREPPVNHPGTTREPPVNHPWTTRETSVLETRKTGSETRKNWFCTVSDPWNTREAPVKHPWSTREWSGDAQWTCINGQMVSIFLQVPNIKCSLS